MNIAICDDEKYSRDIIVTNIKSFITDKVQIELSEFCCGEDLITAYDKKGAFDILFLDVKMKSLDGIQTALHIREIDKDVMIIFITSYDCYFPDAFRVNAFQLLTKPINEEKFASEFKRALEQYKINHYQYLIKTKEDIVAFNISDILYIEAYDRHLCVHTCDKSMNFVGKMSDEEEALANYDFIRCHQGFLVNLSYLNGITKNYAVLSNGKEIPISKSKKSYVMNKYSDYIITHCI